MDTSNDLLLNSRQYVFTHHVITNCSTPLFKNEEWRALPVRDQNYMISNFGRLKRIVVSKPEKGLRNSEEYITLPRILPQRKSRADDFFYRIAFRIYPREDILSFQADRMVYFRFVKQFDLTDRFYV